MWRSVWLKVRIEDESEQEHLGNAMFIEGKNDDSEDFRSTAFSNIEFQDSYTGTMPSLTCIGTGWESEDQKIERIQQYKDAAKYNEKLHGIYQLMSGQGFSNYDYHYYIEDDVIVELLIGDDEMEPI